MVLQLSRGRHDRNAAHEKLTPPEIPVLIVPPRRSLEPFFPAHPRAPTQKAVDLRPITGMAEDLARPISDAMNLVGPVAHQLYDVVGDARDRAMGAARDVEDLAVDQAAGGIHEE